MTDEGRGRTHRRHARRPAGIYDFGVERDTLGEAEAELIHDKSAFEPRWAKDLDRWFPNGIDTAGMELVKVRASRIHWWDGEDEGEIAL